MDKNVQPLIEVKNLSAWYETRKILDSVSFEAFPNEITVILGRSGCGKTTLLKHLIGLYPIQQGEVEILGFSLKDIDEKEYEHFAHHIGVLFQNGALLNSITVAENVAIPLEQHTDLPAPIIEKLVSLKLQLVELSQAANLYPSQLSGGMRKRAALARALALDPPLLFCDEPSAGLDPVTLAALDRLFLRLKNDLHISIILVTHEIPSILRLADRIVFLENGKAAFVGTPSEALKTNIQPVREFFKQHESLPQPER